MVIERINKAICKLKAIEDVAGCLSILAGYKKYETLLIQYPGKFEPPILKNFIGAKTNVSGLKNREASRLESYMKLVMSGKDTDTDKIEYLHITSIGMLLKSENVSLNSDLLIYILGEDSVGS